MEEFALFEYFFKYFHSFIPSIQILPPQGIKGCDSFGQPGRLN